jgi:MFS family permease
MGRIHQTFSHIKSLPSAFWVVIAATLMNQIGNMAMVFLVLYLNQHMGFSLSQASFAFAAFSASMLITGLFSGNLIDRIGAVRIMPASLFLNGIVLLLFPLIHGYATLIFLCLAWGFAFGLYRPASQTFVSELSTTGMHKITFSVFRLVLNLGMSIGPAIGGYLATHSFAAIFLANGFANLLASAILIAGLARSTWFKPNKNLSYQRVLGIRWLKSDRALRLFVISMVPITMIFFQHESTLAVFLKQDLSLPISFYGLLFTLNTLIIVFCELPLNIATMHWPYRMNFMLGSLFITAGFAGLYVASTAWHVVLLTVIWTVGEMILFPSASSYIADIAPEAHRGSYMSVYASCSNLGMLFGPWGGAIVMEQFGADGLWLACGLWGIISVVMFNSMHEPGKLVTEAAH